MKFIMSSLRTYYRVSYQVLMDILCNLFTRTLCTYYAVNYEVLMDILLSDFYVPYGHITRFLTEGGHVGYGRLGVPQPPLPCALQQGVACRLPPAWLNAMFFFGTSVNMQQQRSRSQVELLQQVLGLVLELHLQLFRKQQRRQQQQALRRSSSSTSSIRFSR